MSSAICFNLDQSKILSSGNGLMKLKSLRAKEEKLVMSNFSFTHNIPKSCPMKIKHLAWQQGNALVHKNNSNYFFSFVFHTFLNLTRLMEWGVKHFLYFVATTASA